MHPQHPLRRAGRALLRSPKLWVEVFIPTAVTAVLLGIVASSQRDTVVQLTSQLSSSEISPELVHRLEALRSSIPLYIAVLIPLGLVLLFLWLIALARLTDHIRTIAAPHLMLPRQRPPLLPQLLGLGALLIVAKVAVLLVPLPLSLGQSLLLRSTLLLLLVLFFSAALPIVVLLRPTFRTLARTVFGALRREWGSAASLLAIDVLAVLAVGLLLGYPLSLAMAAHRFLWAFIAAVIIAVASVMCLVVHVAAWDILVYSALTTGEGTPGHTRATRDPITYVV